MKKLKSDFYKCIKDKKNLFKEGHFYKAYKFNDGKYIVETLFEELIKLNNNEFNEYFINW